MNRKFSTYVCCFIMAVFAMNLTIISPLLIEISKTFSLNIAQSGFIFTIEFAGFITFVLLAGLFTERLGKKAVVSFSLIGFTASLLLFSFAQNFLSACIIMFFLGGFGGVIESLITSLVSDLNDINKSFYVNLSQVFFGLGALVGPVVAGLTVSYGISWRISYQVLAALSLVLTLVFIIRKLPPLTKTDKVTFANIKRLLSDRNFLLICLCMLLYTGAEVGGWGWLCTLLKQSMGFSSTKSGIAVAVFWMAMTIGRFLCGPLTLRYSLKHIITVLAFLSAVVTMLSIVLFNEIAIWIVVAAMGFTYSSQFPFIASFGARLTDAPSSTVFSLLIGSGGLGSMLVPYIMGVVGNNAGMRNSMLIPAILLLFVGLIFSRFKNLPKEIE